MPKANSKKVFIDVEADDDPDYQVSNDDISDDESSDSEEGDAEMLLEQGDLSNAERRQLEKLMKLQKVARQRQAQKQREEKQAKLKRTLKRLEKKYGAISTENTGSESSDEESLPDIATRRRGADALVYTQKQHEEAIPSTSTGGHTKSGKVAQGNFTRNKTQKGQGFIKSPRGKAASTEPTRTASQEKSKAKQKRKGTPKKPKMKIVVHVSANDAREEEAAVEMPGACDHLRSPTPPGTPNLYTPRKKNLKKKKRTGKLQKTPRSSSKKKKGQLVSWLSSESESDSEDRKPNWEPAEIITLFEAATCFRSDILNEFSGVEREVRDARRARAYRTIQADVNAVGGNGRRATHILRKMRDFKSKTKLKARELAQLKHQTGAAAAEPEEHLEPEEIMCLDFYGIEHGGAIPGATIRPVNDSDGDSDEVYNNMDAGNQQQIATTKQYVEQRKNERKVQAEKYGFKPIRMVPISTEKGNGGVRPGKAQLTTAQQRRRMTQPISSSTPQNHVINHTGSNSAAACNIPEPGPQQSEKERQNVKRKIEGTINTSISDELGQLWPCNKIPRRELSFSELDTDDALLASPLADPFSAPNTPRRPDAAAIIIVDPTPPLKEKKSKTNNSPQKDNSVAARHVPFSSFSECLRKPASKPAVSEGIPSCQKEKSMSTQNGVTSSAHDATTKSVDDDGVLLTEMRETASRIVEVEKKIDSLTTCLKITQQLVLGLNQSSTCPDREILEEIRVGISRVSNIEHKLEDLSAFVQLTQQQVQSMDEKSIDRVTLEELRSSTAKISNVDKKLDDLSENVHTSQGQANKTCEDNKTSLAALGCRSSLMNNRISNIERLCTDLNNAASENPTTGDITDRVDQLEKTCGNIQQNVANLEVDLKEIRTDVKIVKKFFKEPVVEDERGNENNVKEAKEQDDQVTEPKKNDQIAKPAVSGFLDDVDASADTGDINETSKEKSKTDDGPTARETRSKETDISQTVVDIAHQERCGSQSLPNTSLSPQGQHSPAKKQVYKIPFTKSRKSRRVTKK